MPSHSNSTRPEILAPAGNADMLCAAVFAGADAVYLGLQNFNARRTAGNFTTEGLRQAVAFCHARDVRVYVTLNTTLYPGELTALAEAVAGIAAGGADAANALLQAYMRLSCRTPCSEKNQSALSGTDAASQHAGGDQ